MGKAENRNNSYTDSAFCLDCFKSVLNALQTKLEDHEDVNWLPHCELNAEGCSVAMRALPLAFGDPHYSMRLPHDKWLSIRARGQVSWPEEYGQRLGSISD
jgi:hypothetical protein